MSEQRLSALGMKDESERLRAESVAQQNAMEALQETIRRFRDESERLRAEVERLTGHRSALVKDHLAIKDERDSLRAEVDRLRSLLLKHYLDPDEQVGDAIEELEAERGAC